MFFDWSSIVGRLVYAAGTLVFTGLLYGVIYVILRQIGELAAINRALSLLRGRLRTKVGVLFMVFPIWLNLKRQAVMETITGLDWAGIALGLAGMLLFGIAGVLVLLAFAFDDEDDAGDEPSEADTDRSEQTERRVDDETHW